MSQAASVGFSTGLVGAGGGFLFVPVLVLVGGLPMKTAIGTSTLVTAANAFAGLAGQLSHTSIDWSLALSISTAAIVGAILGSRLIHRMPPEKLRKIFGCFVFLMAVFMLFKELWPRLSQ